MTIFISDAVQTFTEMFHDVSVNKLVSLDNEIEKFIAFYKDTRITNVSLEDEGDLLLLEWGETNPHVMSEVVDFTINRSNAEEIVFHPDRRKWLGLTRQIDLGDGEHSEVDEGLLGFCLYFFFELSSDSGFTGDGEEWFDLFDGISEMDRLKNVFLNAPSFDYFKKQKPIVTNAFISKIG